MRIEIVLLILMVVIVTEDFVKKLIDHKQSKKARWISVEDDLPKDCVIVLVKGLSENPHRKGYDVCWRCWGDWTTWHLSKITHWMPLPAPPEKP